MSYDIFKQNMLAFMRNQPNIAYKEQFAKKLVQEYDALIKRGFDTLNGIPLQQGNTEVMEQILGGVLNTAFQQSSGEHAIITNMGKAFQAYWTSGNMFLFPPPIPSITPIGVFVHIAQTSNFITNSGTWTPSDVTLETPLDTDVIEYNVYEKLDWSKIPLDKNDPEVQEIIKPNITQINQKIIENKAVTDEEKNSVTQMNNIKAEIIDAALYEQGLIDTKTDIKGGYRTLDKLLQIAGKLARKLGKNPRVKYENLKSSYKQEIHGLCPQGTQAVVAALTGIDKLGTISGHADWFSFKEKTTDGGRNSFAIEIGGKTYYNNKVKVNKEWITDPTKWQVGDIISQGYSSKKYGHIQVWTGFAWVSDFTQRKVQTSGVDFTTIALWRLNQNGIAAVESQKIG